MIPERAKFVEIKKGWFRQAGVQYGWLGRGYDVLGVGLDKSFLVGAEKLLVKVAGVTYVVDTSEALDFIRENRSFYRTTTGKKIGVISKSLMKKLWTKKK